MTRDSDMNKIGFNVREPKAGTSVFNERFVGMSSCGLEKVGDAAVQGRHSLKGRRLV